MKILPVIADIWKADKIRGFYKGFIPPLVASSAYRSIQFSAYAATFSACEHVPFLAEPIPFTGGLRISVLLGACASAFARATIESPFDFIKVRKQTGSPWYIGDGSLKSMISPQMVRQLYNGYIPTLKRTLFLMGSFFILVDYSVRYIPDVINMPVYGPFFKVCRVPLYCFENLNSYFWCESKKSIRCYLFYLHRQGWDLCNCCMDICLSIRNG